MVRWAALAVVGVGCADGPVPVPMAEVVVDVAFRAGDLEGTDAVALSGVAIDPDGGRVLLDAWSGLYDVDADGVPTLRAGPEALTPTDGWDRRPFTDVAALEPGAFAVTVTGDGLRYDEGTGETRQHFCYEPDDMEPEATQTTESVAFDADRGLIYAQPRTQLGGEVTEASVGAYDVTGGGQPINWFVLDDREFFAGGMAVDGDDLVLAQGTTLFRGPVDDAVNPFVDLGALVADDVRGVAIDPATDRLVLVTADRWLEIEGWRP
jgi:hypothetical protein